MHYIAIVIVSVTPMQSVLQCDFLNVRIMTRGESAGTAAKQELLIHRDGNTVHGIREGSFDVVVFSLLLSYMPSTEQRMECCIKAHSLLVPHGILLIITADSSHQNRHVDMMKSWRSAIEAVGFQRWKYVKDVHLHCLGFRKTLLSPVTGYSSVHSRFHQNMTIPQDKTRQ